MGRHKRWKKENCLDTLAAAYAEAGDFESAVKWETKALDGVPEQKRPCAILGRGAP
jgi:hypothetical protein